MSRSRTISGIICLVAICAPLVIAPFQLEASLRFVHDLENRTPNAFPAFEEPNNLLDSGWWASISRAFEDRVPFRKQMVTLDRIINPAKAGDRSNRKVEHGVENWLFFRKSLAEDLGTLEETKQAIEAIESFVANTEFKADLFIVVAPNKVTIYPEKLTQASQEKFAQSKAQRELLYTYFAKPDAPYLVDVWTPMFALKESSDELIYEPGGSHYNSLGAMVLARAMIDAADPTLWNDDERIEEWTKTDIPDIAKVIGDWDMKETHTRIQIHRPGIEIVELWDTKPKGGDSKRINNPDFLSINEISYYNRRHVINRSISQPVIPGKTLILFDSFIGHYLHPTLAQFFEDVELVHIGSIDRAFFRQALDTYDRVYFQSAERHIIPRAIEFFGTPE